MSISSDPVLIRRGIFPVRLLLLLAAWVFAMPVLAQDGPGNSGPPSDGAGADTAAVGETAAPTEKLDSPGTAHFSAPPRMALGAGPVIGERSRRPVQPGGWFFLVNCVLIILLSVKYLAFPSFFRKSWNALFNENLFFQFIREKAPVSLVVILIDGSLKLYMLAATLMLLLEVLLPGYHMRPADLLNIAGLLLVFYLLKYFAEGLVAALTDTADLLKTLLLNSVVFSSGAAFFLIPLILVAAYLSEPYRTYGVFAVFALISGFILFLAFRVFRIFVKTGVPINLQFFIYLCALEIMPYLFLAKVFETRYFE